MIFRILSVLGVMAVAGSALAAEKHALVVATDKGDILVEGGKAAGLQKGAPVSLFHVVKAKHPVTGALVVGAFPIGSATVKEVGTVLSLLDVEDAALARRIVPGDEIHFDDTPIKAAAPQTPSERPAVTPPERPLAVKPIKPAPPEIAVDPNEGPAELVADARAAILRGQYDLALRRAHAAVRKSPEDLEALELAGLAACYGGRAEVAAHFAAHLRGERQKLVRQVCARRGSQLPETLVEGPDLDDLALATGTPAGEVAPPPVDPQIQAALAAAIGAASGHTADEARKIWQRYLEDHPRSPFAERVRRELDELDRGGHGVTQPAEAAEFALPTQGFHHAAPARVVERKALAIAIAMGTREAPHGAWLQYRGERESTWQKVELAPSGDGYLRGEIPADGVRAPNLYYFAEALYGDSDVRPVVGDEHDPIAVPVVPTVELASEPKHDRSRVSALAEYVDFNAQGSGHDRYELVETDFMYRFLKPVYAMRIGLGVMKGTGGKLDDYAGNDHTGDCAVGPAGPCRERVFTYAYSELEFHPQKNLAVAGRVYGGTLKKDSNPSSNFGLMIWGRVGEERGTSLALGLTTVGDFGTTAEIKLQWGRLDRVPITGIVQATNLPAGDELGFRGIVEVGYKALPWFYPTLRVGWDAKTINHAGPSAGFAAVFDW